MPPVEIDQDQFIDLLGVDWEKDSSGCVKICCPFHDDTHPSLKIYPEMGRACHCYVCGQTWSWPWLLAKVKNVSFPEACRMMQLPDGSYNNGGTRGALKIDMTFCDKPTFVDAFTEKHEKCNKKYPISVTKWLEKKGLCRAAQDLDWRWHDGSVFKKWGKGILIPYKDEEGNVIWERFRGEAIEGNFEKPIGPADVGIQPYYNTFRKNDTVYLVEGESDAASIYDHHGSAIGIPGARAKKAINSVACFINDRPYITRAVLCGDQDVSGKEMNKLYREALSKFVDRPLEIIEYEHQVEDKKADVNDDHARGLLKLPIKWTSFYGDNHERNYGVFGGVISTLEAPQGPSNEKKVSYTERIKTWLKKRITA